MHNGKPEPARICQLFIVSGTRLLREALGRILNKRSDFLIVGSSSYSEDIVQRVHALGPDVLLADLPAETKPASLVHRICQDTPGVRVVVIGTDADEDLFLQVVRAGAVGFVPRDASATDVVAAVRAVTQGEAVCPPRLCLTLFQCVARGWTDGPNPSLRVRYGLTRREQQLMPLIADGLTNKEIASQLTLSEQTVKNHVHRLLKKFGASDRMAVAELWQDKTLRSMPLGPFSVRGTS